MLKGKSQSVYTTHLLCDYFIYWAKYKKNQFIKRNLQVKFLLAVVKADTSYVLNGAWIYTHKKIPYVQMSY